MRADEDVFVMGEDIAEMGGSMGVTQGLVEEFGPERVRNTPISEMAIVGAGIGAAMQGMRPVVEIMYEDFLTLSLEQIVNQAAKHRYMSGGQLKVPLTIRTQGGAGWSPGAQHAQQLEAWLVHVPGLKVVFAVEPGRRARPPLVVDLRRQPGDLLRAPAALPGQGRGAREARAGAARQGARRPRGERRDRDRDRARSSSARSRPPRRPRSDGISVEIVDPRTLQPLDEDTLVESVKKTNRAVVAHEAVTRMGFGAEVAAVLQEKAFDWLDAPIERVGAKFAPLAFAPAMEQFVVPQPADVLAAVKKTRGARLMATDVKLPRLGQGMESGTIVKWLKAEGDTVEKGEPLYEVDTDKATQEVEAEASGVLLRIAVAEGEVPVGQTVAVIGERRRGHFGRAVRNGSWAREEPAPQRGRAARPRRVSPRARDQRRPRARRPAASRPRRSRAGWRASAASTSAAVTGTGPDGRIVAEDVERGRRRPGRPGEPAATPQRLPRRGRAGRR